jgi:excisionase family DNA binding protein
VDTTTKEEMILMATVAGHDALLSYDEAARLLGIQRESVRQLVMRGHLHSVPAPEDRRRRRLSRAEVEAYAQAHAGKWSYAESAIAKTVSPAPLAQPVPSPELLVAGAASVTAIALLVAALRKEADTTTRMLLIGAVAALALVLIVERYRQGRLDDAERRRLERLAKQAEAGVETEAFIAELEQLLPAA